MHKKQSGSCPKLPTEPHDCQHFCWPILFVSLTKEILDCKEEIKDLIRSKIPDQPLVLVNSREVCKFVAIEPKTLYRCEKKNMISYHSRNNKGKLFRYEDMVKLRKTYHNLPD